VSRAAGLADQLDQLCEDFAAYLAGLSPEQWRARCANHPTIRRGDEDENRPVGTVAHHVAVALPRQLRYLRAIVSAEEVPAPAPTFNAEHAAANPEPDQAETTALLRRNASEVGQVIRGLSEEDLERSGHTVLGELTAGEAVERICIGHVTWHEGSIKATLGG
jgi:hypothetical protein